ncbi:MAG: hypothetical protein IPO45_17505 [Saprospiraceae bacterium]|jgi:hypothetical protein|uniref:hypothetical protein n=1 Tax=Candidatus Brachybacter algidus TaxID=2982024 RepID=UPI001DC31F43|nr:hypothetical protein [Candidatus Brachybacter algidus]HQW70427.1 hypothetical protein [Saprospiraceae bacterium]MBK6374204.1 hypothetical protein [Candidatus Brachybacter algidus]MBK6449989.1 hypothetical protein [Candidatus Brachybacter algidus]MBK7604136.1 hypothetical protein [Candidatus Brachybacter algidus]MBK8603834.1 hypothetical protein [Candidatus Brachybacter algidus]
MKLKFIAIMLFAFVYSLTGVQAQQGNKKGQIGDRIQAQMVAYLTSELSLTPQEAEKFWPLYNEYKNKERLVKRGQIPSKAIDLMNEGEASAFLNNTLEAEEKELELKKYYTKEFRKVLPATKVAKLQQAERGFKKELIKKISKQNRNERGD